MDNSASDNSFKKLDNKIEVLNHNLKIVNNNIIFFGVVIVGDIVLKMTL